jgi:hypothetical protein
VSVKESALNDQAIQATVRRLIPPISRPCSLAPSATTPLYRTTVSEALRRSLSGLRGEPRFRRSSSMEAR